MKNILRTMSFLVCSIAVLESPMSEATRMSTHATSFTTSTVAPTSFQTDGRKTGKKWRLNLNLGSKGSRSIASLTNISSELTELNLFVGKLEQLPGLSKLSWPKLEELCITGDELESLVELSVSHLPSLKKLYIASKKLKSLAGLFGSNLPSLTKLNLSFNALTSLNGLPPLLGLTELDLRNNALASLDGFVLPP